MTAPGPDAELVRSVAELVRRSAGLSLTGARTRALSVAIASTRRDRTREEYLSELERQGPLYEALLEQLTVKETFFFRGGAQLELLRDEILSALRREIGARRLRVWSAGCATGDEPYTVAILLSEMGWGSDAYILGTDISPAALEAARSGRYRRWSLRATPPHLLARYFRRRGDEFELDPEIRASVDFRRLNLLADDFPAPGLGIHDFDLILCRNVLLYFDRPAVDLVARKLVASLGEDGWLLPAASDPILASIREAGARVVVTEAGLAYSRGWRPLAAEPGWSRSTPRSRERTIRPVDRPQRGGAGTKAQGATGTGHALEGPRVTGTVAKDRVGTGPDPAAPPRPASRAVAQPRGAEEWHRLAHGLADRGDLKSACQTLAGALGEHPESVELRLLSALVLGESGQLSDAIRAARAAVFLDPSSVFGHVTLATLYDRCSDGRPAERSYTNALGLLEERSMCEEVPGMPGETVASVVVGIRQRLRRDPPLEVVR